MKSNYRKLVTVASFVAAAVGTTIPATTMANAEVERLTANPNNWAIWGGNYAGQRYSQLSEINNQNVGDLQVAWTFSTGVLRGHEGGPMVIGDGSCFGSYFHLMVWSDRLMAKTLLGNGVCTYIVLPMTNGPPSCPRSTPVEKVQATCKSPAFSALI